jgi:hypothetical protein
LKQVPVFAPDKYSAIDLNAIVPRVIELTYVSDDMNALASDVWHSSDPNLKDAIVRQAQSNRGLGPRTNASSLAIHADNFTLGPFEWDQSRRASVRAELDAYYAHLYGLTRDELRYILDPKDLFGAEFPSETFRVLKEREEKEYGEYRTQRLVLEAFDKLAESTRFRSEMPKRETAFTLPEQASTAREERN